MHETPADLEQLQRLIEHSHASAGPHLRSIATADRQLDATAVVAEMGSMRVTALATTIARGEPRVAPVDGLFYRGRLHFGSGADSVRIRHLRARPAVSASAIEGERLQITIHGTAREVIPAHDPGLEEFLISVYGRENWESWMRDAPWTRIEPERMITFHNPIPSEE